MHRIALHRLESAWSLSEGIICVKACQFLGFFWTDTRCSQSHLAGSALSAESPARGSLAAKQSHGSGRSSAPLCPGQCFSLPADATGERTWAEGYPVTHVPRFCTASVNDSSPVQARLARPLLPTVKSTASCKDTGASSAIHTAARASLEFLGLVPFSTSHCVTQLHRFSLQTWWWISPSTRRDHLRTITGLGLGCFSSSVLLPGEAWTGNNKWFVEAWFN